MNRLLKPVLAPGNALVKRLLRSRFHWPLSRYVVLLEVTGRRSGRTYLVPVNYRPFEGGVSVMTYRQRQWWWNISSGSDFPVYLRGRRRMMRPEVITDDTAAITAGLRDRGWIRKSVASPEAEDSVLIRLHVEDDS